jgi:hypothetical protein
MNIEPIGRIRITDPRFRHQEQVDQVLTIAQDLGDFWIAKSELGYYYRVEKWQARLEKIPLTNNKTTV